MCKIYIIVFAKYIDVTVRYLQGHPGPPGGAGPQGSPGAQVSDIEL